MEFAAFFQSLSGQPATGGLSEKANTSNRWPSTVTASENQQQGSFDQTVRQLIETMGSDRQADQKRTDPEQPGADDPNMMLLVEMIGPQAIAGHDADILTGSMLSAQVGQSSAMTPMDGQQAAWESSLSEMMGTFGDTAPSDSAQMVAMISAVMGGVSADGQPKDPMGTFGALIENDGRNVDAGSTIVGKTTVDMNETIGAAGFTVEGEGSNSEALPSGDAKLMSAFQDGAGMAVFTTSPGVNRISTRPVADAKSAVRMGEGMVDEELAMEPEGDDSVASGDHPAATTATPKVPSTLSVPARAVAGDPINPMKTDGSAVSGEDDTFLNQQRPSAKTGGSGVEAPEGVPGNALKEEILKSESHHGSELQSNLPGRTEDHSVKRDASRLSEASPAGSGAPETMKPDTITYDAAKTAVQGNSAVETRPPTTTAASGPAQEAGEAGFRRAIVDQIVQKAVVRSSTDRSEIRIQLKPEVLGDVRMSIVSEKNQLVVRMIADKPAVKEIIESHIHQLRAELDKHGLTVEKIEVLVNTEDHHQQNREQFFQMSKNGSFGGGRRQSGGRHQEPPAQQQSTEGTGSEPSPDGISYFA